MESINPISDLNEDLQVEDYQLTVDLIAEDELAELPVLDTEVDTVEAVNTDEASEATQEVDLDEVIEEMVIFEVMPEEVFVWSFEWQPNFKETYQYSDSYDFTEDEALTFDSALSNGWSLQEAIDYVDMFREQSTSDVAESYF